MMFTMTRRERIVENGTDDSSLELDAARALTEFCLQAHMPARSPAKALDSGNLALPQWSGKKVRSSRSKRPECSSNDSHTIASSNDCPLVPQFSECSSSVAKDSQSVVIVVKAEEIPCSSSEGERRTPPAADHPNERHEKLAVSDSSNESLQPDSRADSPSSPLPSIRAPQEILSIGVIPKFQDSLAAGRSAFQRVMPIRPVKKATSTVCRKLKVEEKFFEDSNVGQAAVKHVSRKKPRPTGIQLAPVKIEEADSFCTLTLAPGPVATEEAKRTQLEEVRVAVPAVAAEEKTVDLNSVLIKVESKPPARVGPRAGGKLKPVLSECEKEARRQRRVQANRESARQTIRRKQVLCEELSKKSQNLSAENEAFRKELELLRQKHKNLREMNAHLTEQVQSAKASTKTEAGCSSSQPGPSPAEKPPGFVPIQFPVHFTGLHMPLPQYLWAFAVAQATGMQPGEITLNADYAPALAPAFGQNLPAGFWMRSAGPGQPSVMPPFFASQHFQHTIPTVTSNAPSSSTDAPTNCSPLSRAVSLPAGPGDGHFPLVSTNSDRGFVPAKPIASFRSGDFADPLHRDPKKVLVVKSESVYQGSGFSSRTNGVKLPPSSQAGMMTPALGSMTIRNSADGTRLSLSNAPGQLLGRSQSCAAASQLPSTANSRYPGYPSGGRCFPEMSMSLDYSSTRESQAQRAAAAATEARRRRKELTRTKSMQHRQAARLAEPSAT